MRRVEITSITAEGLLNYVGRSGGDAGKVCMREKTGGVVYKQEVGREGGRKRERGKEKTRLPQHDLQIALSPWRLLSALPSIQSGSPNNLGGEGGGNGVQQPKGVGLREVGRRWKGR